MGSFYRRSQIFLMVFLLVVGFAQATRIIDNNILINSGFEAGIDGWLGINSQDGIEIVDDFAFTGTSSLKFSSGYNGDRNITSTPQIIKYTGNTRYLFSVNYFTTSSEERVNIKANLYSGATMLEVLDLGVLELTKLNQWVTERFLIEIPDLNPPADSIQVCVEVKDTYHGNLWLDDLVLQPVLVGKNKIANSGFEGTDPKAGWFGPAGIIDNIERHSGNNSCKLIGDINNNWNCFYTSVNTWELIKCNPGDTVRVSFYYKMEEVNDPIDLEIRLRFLGLSGVATVRTNYLDEVVSGEWVKCVSEFVYQHENQGFSLYFFITTKFKGTVWFDDVEILVIPEQNPESVVGFVANRSQEELEKINCQWQANSKQPFRYNIYMSQDTGFEPSINNLVASVAGNLTNYDIEIPFSRLEEKYYLAISAVDEGGQESVVTRTECVALCLVKMVFESASTGERIPEAKITIENELFEADAQGELELYLLEGSYNYQIKTPGFIAENGQLDVIYDAMGIIEFSLDAKEYPPPAVVEAWANNETPGLIKLCWKVPEPFMDELPYKYEIHKSAISGFEPTIDTLMATIVGIQTVGALHEWKDYDVVGGQNIYYYRVVAVNDALIKAESFEVEAFVNQPENTSFISPNSSLPVTSFPLRFEWTEVTDAIGYELQIADNEEFTGQSLITLRFDADCLSYDFEGSLVAGQWFCRIRTCYDDNIVSGFSTPLAFMVVSLDTSDLLPYLNIAQEMYNPNAGPLSLTYVVTKPTKVTISVFTPRGRLCEALLSEQLVLPGSYQVLWQGKENGVTVKNGLYIIKINLSVDGKETIIYKKVMVWKR